MTKPEAHKALMAALDEIISAAHEATTESDIVSVGFLISDISEAVARANSAFGELVDEG